MQTVPMNTTSLQLPTDKKRFDQWVEKNSQALSKGGLRLPDHDDQMITEADSPKDQELGRKCQTGKASFLDAFNLKGKRYRTYVVLPEEQPEPLK